MFAFVMWLVVGGIAGWMASVATRTDAQQGVLMNIVAGVVGAFLASLVTGGGTLALPEYSIASMTTTFAGSAVLLAIVNLFKRSDAR